MIFERIAELADFFNFWEIVLALLVILAATSVQVGAGIAFGIVAGPLLALINIRFVPVPVLLLTFATASSAFWAERRGVKWDQIRYAVSGRILGSIIGAGVLSIIPGEKTFMLIFGSIIAFAVLISISGVKIPFTLASVGFAGTVSGFTAAITSVGGPPMAVVYQSQRSSEARPTLQVYFALGAFFTLAILFISGHGSLDDFLLALILIPAMVAGFMVGPRLKPCFDRGFRTFLLLTAAVAAMMLIYRGLS